MFCSKMKQIKPKNIYVEYYRIPGIFRGMYISRLSMKQGFSQLKFRG